MIVLLAAKSLVIAGGTLLVLRLMRGRSAADRSWIAHLGIAALAALPLGSMLFPPLELTSSYTAFLARTAPAGAAQASAGPDWLFIAYVVPALFLVARMLLALLRLVSLTARARTVTDDRWLQALAEDRRRIGSTKRTALLASREIASPISWGVLQPRILLNLDAVDAHADADAIVAHELAHYVLGHDAALSAPTADARLREREQRELDANAKSVEILNRVRGVPEDQALRMAYSYLLNVHRRLQRSPGEDLLGHRPPCEEIADLLARYPAQLTWTGGLECAPPRAAVGR